MCIKQLSYQSNDIMGVQRQADAVDKNLLLQCQVTRMLALRSSISWSRELSLPVPPHAPELTDTS